MSEGQQTTGERTLAAMFREVSLGGHGGDSWTGDEDEAPKEPQYYTAYLRGGLSSEGIAAQVAQHFLIYEALEAATDSQILRHGDDFTFAMPELRRLPSLVSDLEHWIGPDWEEQVRGRYSTPGILAYTARITEVAHDSLPHFIAHHYTRYLADLSGGFMIAKMFRESYGIESDAGVRFYIFDGIEQPREYKDSYRALLNEVTLTDDEKLTATAEVALAYELNGCAGGDLEERFAEYRA